MKKRSSYRFFQLNNLAKQKNFSGHIYVLTEDERFELCLGYEDQSSQIPISKKSVFPIASGTKFLTALAIGKLIDQGKITLDTYPKDILDLGITSYAHDIKIKHLLSHTSGIPDYLDENLQDTSKIDNKKLLETKDYLAYFPHTDMEFKPGSRFKYNDGAFVYLALIIEKLSHMSYQDFINLFIFKPLHIDQSGIFKTSSKMMHKVVGYVDQERKIPHVGYIPEMAGGDGGAYMNAYDFHRLIKDFFRGQIISDRLVKDFVTPHIQVDENETLFYGYGLWLKKCHDHYIPHVIGVDAGIRFKSLFTENKFYYLVTNTNDDVWDMMEEMDKLICNH